MMASINEAMIMLRTKKVVVKDTEMVACLELLLNTVQRYDPVDCNTHFWAGYYPIGWS